MDKPKEVTIIHPAFGTLHLSDCTYEIIDGKEYVIGEFYNYDTPTSDGCLKETMNFPITCIKE